MSRHKCAAHSCYNTYLNKPFLKFFFFPKEIERARLWARNAGRPDLLNVLSGPKKFVLCAEHFEEQLFINPKFKVKFKQNVSPVPTIFQNNLLDFVPKSVQEKLSKGVDSRTCLEQQPVDINLEETRTKIEPVEIQYTLGGFCNDMGESTISVLDDKEKDKVSYTGAVEIHCEESLLAVEEIIICRLCASKVPKIRSKDIFMEENNKIKEMINSLLSIKAVEGDGIPKYVCVSCESKLNFCTKIVHSFMKSDAYLREKINSGEGIERLLKEPKENCTVMSYKLEDEERNVVIENYNIVKTTKCYDKNLNIESEDCDRNNLFIEELLDLEMKIDKNNMLKCLHCPAEFNSELSLKRHENQIHSTLKKGVRSNKETKFVKCVKCNKLLPDTKYNSHVVSHLPKENQCEFCGMQYRTMKQLKNHLITHEDLFCSFCGKEFSSVKNKRSHVKTHVLPGMLCEVCGKFLSDVRSLESHLRTHHKEGEFCCLSCKKSFGSKVELEVHTALHTKTFSCPICSKVFHAKSLVRQHLLSHSNVSPFSCHCGASFNRYGNLHQHIKKQGHHKMDQKILLFECRICKRKLKSKIKLRWHLAKHAGIKKPFDCEICGSQFSTIGYYRTHIRTHTGERPFKCTTCGSSFRTVATLKQHKFLHKNEFPYHCQECDRVFKRLHSLIIHKRTHTGDRPHKCPICSRRFLQKPDLRRHLQSHSKSFPLQDLPLSSEEMTIPLEPIIGVVQPVNNNMSNPSTMLFGVDLMSQVSPGNSDFMHFMVNLPIIEVQPPSLNQSIQFN